MTAVLDDVSVAELSESSRIELKDLQGWWLHSSAKIGRLLVTGVQVCESDGQRPWTHNLVLLSDGTLQCGHYVGKVRCDEDVDSRRPFAIDWSRRGLDADSDRRSMLCWMRDQFQGPDRFLSDNPSCNGRFEYRKYLGRGGFGQVFSAIDRHKQIGSGRSSVKHQEVAIKVPRTSGSFTSQHAQRHVFRMHREFTWSHKCLHNRDHKLYDKKSARFFVHYLEDQTGFSLKSWKAADEFGILLAPDFAWMEKHEIRTQPYVTMDCIDGELSWKSILRLGTSRLTDVVQQLASALNYLTRFHLIHRDLRLHNIMLRREGKRFMVTVIDFGLMINYKQPEKLNAHPEAEWEAKDWIPPEHWVVTGAEDEGVQLKAENFHSYDVFSLGVCTLYLCRGQSETRNILKCARAGQTPVLPVGELPCSESLIRSMINMDYNQRPHPEAVLDALEAAPRESKRRRTKGPSALENTEEPLSQ